MGHVFVVHGDVLAISADIRLIPCDASGEVLEHWNPYGPAGDRAALAAELRTSRVSKLRTVAGQRVRYVDSGATKATADPDWLGNGLRAGVTAAVGDVGGTPGANGRAQPLIAMPVFGVGAGGYGAIRGEALRAQLAAVAGVVRDTNVDVVVVCFQRADFAAMQMQRVTSDWDLPESMRVHSESLAESIQAEQVVLFLGAGVSVAAGIGDFANLVSSLEVAAGILDDASAIGSDDYSQRADRLRHAEGEDWVRAEVAKLVLRPHYSLTHGLLASLRIREAITTNFDSLYEKACERPFHDTGIDVAPWQRSSARTPWLLKAHGDPTRAGGLVLDEASYDSFEQDRAPTAGIVRAMLALSREMLFVGYSLQDPNMVKIIDEARAFHERLGVENRRLGTVLTLSSHQMDITSNPVRFGVQSSPDEPISTAARRLQILLDHMCWAATRGEASWLLDSRYAALHQTEDERKAAKVLAAHRLPESGNWPAVESGLGAFGKKLRPMS